MSTACALALYMCEKRPTILDYIREKRPIKTICLLFSTTHVYCIRTSSIHVRKEIYNSELIREKRPEKVYSVFFIMTHDTRLPLLGTPYIFAKKKICIYITVN